MATSFAFESRSFAAAAFRLKTGSLDAYEEHGSRTGYIFFAPNRPPSYYLYRPR